MSRWASDPDDIRLAIAHAFGTGQDPLDAFDDWSGRDE